MKQNIQTKKITYSAMFLALAFVLPFFTGQMREIGNKLLPMHLPIMLCGMICGWKYGLLIGFITPLLRSFLFSMPIPIKAVGMAFELATYGFIIGLLYYKLARKKLRIYLSLLTAMIAGRVVWGIVTMLICGITKTSFTLQMFLGSTLLNAIPGIIIQLIFIPILMIALGKAGVLRDETN